MYRKVKLNHHKELLKEIPKKDLDQSIIELTNALKNKEYRRIILSKIGRTTILIKGSNEYQEYKIRATLTKVVTTVECNVTTAWYYFDITLNIVF